MRGAHARFPRTVAFAVALALLAAACGGDGRSVPPASPSSALTSSPTPSASVEATETASPTPTATPTPEPRYDDTVASTTLIPLEDLGRVEFESADGTAQLAIEVPPRSEYGIGLSGRYQLADRGMLFYYPEGNRGGFWMRNTHVDLDIAFVDDDLRIIAILRMEADTETVHSPGEVYIAAIEAPAGWYEAASVAPGASVEFLFDVDAALAAAAAALEE